MVATHTGQLKMTFIKATEESCKSYAPIKGEKLHFCGSQEQINIRQNFKCGHNYCSTYCTDLVCQYSDYFYVDLHADLDFYCINSHDIDLMIHNTKACFGM